MKKHISVFAAILAAISLTVVFAGCPDADPDLIGDVNIVEGANLVGGELRADVDAELTAAFVADEGVKAPEGGALRWQWQRNVDGAWNNITGATSDEYTVQEADDGRLIRATVRANGFYGTVSSENIFIGDGEVPILPGLSLQGAYCALFQYNAFILATTEHMYMVWTESVEVMEFMIEHKETGWFEIEIVDDWQGDAWAIQPNNGIYGVNCDWDAPLIYIGPTEGHENKIFFNDHVLNVGEPTKSIRIYKTLGSPDTQIKSISFFSGL